jgi:hypothetical protein
MNDDEYERRRRALEEMYQADLLMVRAAHETRLRCLEALRQADTPGGRPESQPASPPATAPAPVRPARNANPDLREAVLAALPSLPDLFTKEDVVRAIGFTPSRSSLQRVLMDLDSQKIIRFGELSNGRHPTTYRKV